MEGLKGMNVSNVAMTWGMVLAYVVFNASGALAIKYKLSQVGPFHFESWSQTFRYFGTLFASPWVLGGFFCLFASAMAWIIALSRLELSVAYPVAIGLNFLVIITVGLTFYQERLDLEKAIGLLLLIGSLFFVCKV